MSRFEDVVEIQAPIERVWSLAADPRNVSRLNPGASVRLLSGGWTEVGSRHHVTERLGGKVIDSVHEISRWEPPTLVEERMTSGGTVIVATLELTAAATGRTVLLARADVEWGGTLGALIGRIFAPLTGPVRRRQLARIRDLAESLTGDAEAHFGEER